MRSFITLFWLNIGCTINKNLLRPLSLFCLLQSTRPFIPINVSLYFHKPFWGRNRARQAINFFVPGKRPYTQNNWTIKNERGRSRLFSIYVKSVFTRLKIFARLSTFSCIHLSRGTGLRCCLSFLLPAALRGTIWNEMNVHIWY